MKRNAFLINIAGLALAAACGSGSGSSPEGPGGPEVPSTEGRDEEPELGAIGELPVPLDTPPGTIEERAHALAREVLRGGQPSLPALMTALAESGIAIVRSADGTMVSGPDSDARFSVQDYEVQLMAQLEGDHAYVAVDEVEKFLRALDTDAAVFPYAFEMLDAIHTATIAATDQTQFTARFIEAC